MDFKLPITTSAFQQLYSNELTHYQTRQQHLGKGAVPAAPVMLPKLIKKYQDNVISVEEPSRIIPITDSSFISAGHQLPFSFQEDFQQFRFYWLEFPVRLHAVDGWRFSKVEIVLSFNDGEGEGFKRPRIFKIFPEAKFQQYFNLSAEASSEINVGLDADMSFAVKGDVPGYGAAGVDVNGGGKVNTEVKFFVGPFSFEAKKCIIKHDVTGASEIHWQLNKTNYLKENNLKIMVILQVPKTAKAVTVDTAMVAYKNKTFAPQEWLDYIKNAGDLFRSWFDNDLPIPFEQRYDLSAQMD